MAFDLAGTLVIGVSSRALFDLEAENAIFDEQGLEAYSKHQIEQEESILKPGTAFRLIKALDGLNKIFDKKRLTEIIIMSRNGADTSLRIFNSLNHYGLDISRAALSGGGDISKYLSAFKTDLFLSANEEDVQSAANSGIAAGLICTESDAGKDDQSDGVIKIAFDGDAVIFSDEAERIYQTEGVKAFAEHERLNAQKPLPEGAFAKLLKTISFIQSQFGKDDSPIRTALVTARNAPAHERVIRTLRAWGVRTDEAFFLGGIEKSHVLKAFGADIFFDDQTVHTEPASKVVPAARVLLKK